MTVMKNDFACAELNNRKIELIELLQRHMEARRRFRKVSVATMGEELGVGERTAAKVLAGHFLDLSMDILFCMSVRAGLTVTVSTRAIVRS
ncbi:hypothetical protein HWB52_gp43 [Pseudomonas phage Littlefix]|uniref:Uncharacterized protein n=1 Tax=Pseudomonas phage Littlefix TaxID=2079289 RepID=A0A2K9VHU1_9CAUD|nr:hypothetical protein HWB52_gp43 [Pseudomonas phage Littlefix]AUV61858.1 hypothetical protein PsPhLittlefix_gp43 [Pseudomonas phage Littlefix]